MAQGNGPQQDANVEPRVHKASTVHKRRIDRKKRQELAKKVPPIVQVPSPRNPASDVAEAATEALERPPVSTDAQVEAEPKASQAASQAEPQPGLQGKPQSEPSDARPDARPGEAPSDKKHADDDAAGPDRENAAEDTADAAAEPTRPAARAVDRRLVARVAIAAGACVLVAFLVVGGLFAWNRWWRYDDGADMQGEWFVVGTAVPVTIDGGNIYLTDDVTYAYAIDQGDKTISYTFGPMQGSGRYWFSEDRAYLVITDGDHYTASGTVAEDLVHAFRDFAVASSGQSIQLPEGDGIIALARTPDPDALAEKEAREKAAAEEEAARKAAEEAEEEEQAESGYYYYYY